MHMRRRYVCDKFACFHYHRHPPRVSDEMCEGLRDMLALLLCCHVGMTAYVARYACEDPGERSARDRPEIGPRSARDRPEMPMPQHGRVPQASAAATCRAWAARR